MAVFQALQQAAWLVFRELVQAVFEGQHRRTSMSSRKPLFTANSEEPIRLMGSGLYWACFRNSVTRAPAAVSCFAGGLVQVRGELRERGQFAVLRQVGTDTAGQALDQFGLGGTTDARHRDTGVDGGADTGVEQAGFRKIWPSVIEITLVGTKADTSPAWVSMIGSAVSEPVLP